jgi:hypothetical protein
MVTLLVVDAVSDRMDNSEIFTSYDITCSLRNGGETVEHHRVKSTVHMLHDNSTDFAKKYDKKVIPTPGGTAWLYHPNGFALEDIKDYVRNLEWGDDVDVEQEMQSVFNEDDDVDTDDDGDMDIDSLIKRLEID